MTNSNPRKKEKTSSSSTSIFWGNIRKFLILGLILGWLIGYFVCIDRVDAKTFSVLAALVFIYIFDHIYSISLSVNASEFFKSFLFQTTVPLSALLVVAVLAYSNVIDSQATITMFGLALAYTTFVVGKRLRPESSNSINESMDEIPNG
ncbi:MAG: hypothetical protein AAGG51_12690 [Cyanobacteria bacterium P01_G01_bin.54]